ncbi:MAG: hypothetical protein OEU52_16420 [Xanthomonadales bacterium]|nr:hypothetical protein [Xanthomonadales bacterium]
MTEYELADIIATYSSNSGTFFATYLTVLSGYLITAFVAGERLNTQQAFILNTGYIIATFVMIFATYGAGSTQVHYTQKLVALAADSPQLNRDWVMNVTAMVMIGGVVASLYFMWSIRHPKKK